ncbi:uncharacterized protein LOC127446457 isoform X2 [Myxocyprinus asiaticus]|uniref:uncharacterized protein LOC127446457 isoform X2 n=1 Tax=Myxocyprinus asiaticus TaxID=70543 RepID=UPI00222172CF|nr:uncharacterized protein LOC127446457 isoform X2 [Myxocyprinus asiaticus]
MLGLKYTLVNLLFLIINSVTAHGDVIYIRRVRNSSVDFSCESAKKEENLFAFSLKRKLLQPKPVLYLSKGLSEIINESVDKGRITVSELDNHTVHLRISNLQGWDTDVYYCEFHYAREPCSCSGYLLLLYVISAAACLLAVLVVTLITAYCCKLPKSRKPQPVVPVYEEMAGVRPAKGKATSRHLVISKQEVANGSVSTLLSKENLYVKSDSMK